MTGIIALPMQSFVIRMKWVRQKYKQQAFYHFTISDKARLYLIVLLLSQLEKYSKIKNVQMLKSHFEIKTGYKCLT